MCRGKIRETGSPRFVPLREFKGCKIYDEITGQMLEGDKVDMANLPNWITGYMLDLPMDMMSGLWVHCTAWGREDLVLENGGKVYHFYFDDVCNSSALMEFVINGKRVFTLWQGINEVRLGRVRVSMGHGKYFGYFLWCRVEGGKFLVTFYLRGLVSFTVAVDMLCDNVTVTMDGKVCDRYNIQDRQQSEQYYELDLHTFDIVSKTAKLGCSVSSCCISKEECGYLLFGGKYGLKLGLILDCLVVGDFKYSYSDLNILYSVLVEYIGSRGYCMDFIIHIVDPLMTGFNFIDISLTVDMLAGVYTLDASDKTGKLKPAGMVARECLLGIKNK